MISTDPAADSLVKKGDTVPIKVDEVPPPIQVSVPEGITNTTQTNATAILQSAGLPPALPDLASAERSGRALGDDLTALRATP